MQNAPCQVALGALGGAAQDLRCLPMPPCELLANNALMAITMQPCSRGAARRGRAGAVLLGLSLLCCAYQAASSTNDVGGALEEASTPGPRACAYAIELGQACPPRGSLPAAGQPARRGACGAPSHSLAGWGHECLIRLLKASERLKQF